MNFLLFQIIKIIDDHADIISVNVLFGKKGIYNLKLSRFWKLEDDGTYLITYNTVAKGEFEPENAMVYLHLHFYYIYIYIYSFFIR